MKHEIVTKERPAVFIDLLGIDVIEEYGQRDEANEVEAKISFKSGRVMKWKMSPKEFDRLILRWVTAKTLLARVSKFS